MTLGKKILSARREAGVKQNEAARRIGVSKQQWQQWEAGVYTPSYKSLGKIAMALRMKLSSLLSVGE